MRLGVVLFPLAGPDSLRSIEPSLNNLFCSPGISQLPPARMAWLPLAMRSTAAPRKTGPRVAARGARG